jgi:flavin prenyltransferase
MSSLDVIGQHKTVRRMIVGITGATGIIYGVRLLGVLKALGIETHLVVTKAGELTRAHETDLSVDDLRGSADFAYNPNEIGAALASGSFRTMGMSLRPAPSEH